MLGLQVVGVAARDHNVLQLGLAGDVGEGFFPAAAARFERGFGYCGGVGADGVGARAEGAVGRADGGGWFGGVVSCG